MTTEIIVSLCQLSAILLIISEVLVFLMANWMFVDDEQSDSVRKFIIGVSLCIVPAVTIPFLSPIVRLLYWLLPDANYSYLILSLVVLMSAVCLLKSAQLVVAASEYPGRCAKLLAAVFFGIPMTCFSALLLAGWQYGGWVVAGCFIGIIPAVVRMIRRIQFDETRQ